MADRDRTRDRGTAAVDVNGNIAGAIEPPPWHVKEFDHQWKDWLHQLYQTVSLDIGTLWFNLANISAADTPYEASTADQVILADPDTGALVITLPAAAEDGSSYYIKNIDESNTYTLSIDPGTNNIDGQPAGGAPSATDVVVEPLDSYLIVYDSTTTTWWVI